MLLSITERVLLLNILEPAAGDILLLRGVRKLREDLSFSEQEHLDFAMRQEGPVVKWDPDKATEKEVEMGPRAKAYVALCLQRASDAGTLSEGLVRVWDGVAPEEI